MSGALAQPLAITAMGAVSAVGANAPQTCTSIRAGLAGFSEHAYFESLSRDPEWEPGEPLRVASFPLLDPMMDGPGRLLELAIPALIELGGQARLKRSDLRESALLLSIPVADDAVGEWDLETSFIPELCRVTGLADFAVVVANRSGHTGVFELVQEAHRLLAAGECQRCFIIAVDSYLSADRMDVWDRAWRLRSERNADGFIPGEAASALLLELPGSAEVRSADIAALVTAVGFGDESNAQSSDRSSSGAGLCQALAAVIPTGESARWVCCDLNGESYRAFEWGLARVRLHEQLEGMAVLHHPADSAGDVGAASGGILMSHVAYAFGRPRPPAPEAILWTAADDGKRAALRMKAASAV